MNTYTISFSSLFQAKRFSKLFLDYISNTDTTNQLIQNFFKWDYRQSGDFEQHFLDLAKRRYLRPELCSILNTQHETYGFTEQIQANISKLADEKTFTVVTGQQVGLYTGPLYTIYKALSAIALAEKLRDLYPDYDFVPVFWLEAEDHDIEEISTVSSFVGNSCKNLTLEIESHQKQSVGKLKFPESISAFNVDFLDHLPETEFLEHVSACIHECYSPQNGYKQAFAKMLVKLLGDEGLLLIDSDSLAFKSLCKPIFVKEVERYPKTSQNIIAQSALLEEHGYESQAKARAINLFMFDEHGRRLKLEPVSEEIIEVVETRQQFQKNQLLEMIQDSPDRFSPNVILRSIVQDYVLPTSAYIAGPGEISYMAQFKSNYEFFEVPSPIIYPRASITLIEPKIERLISKALGSLKLDGKTDVLEKFFLDPLTFENDLINASSLMDIDEEFLKINAGMENLMKELSYPISQIDLTLMPSLEKLTSTISQQLNGFKSKVIKSEKQKHADLIKQIEKSKTHLLPNDSLQERVVNIMYFLSKYSPNLIQELKEIILKQSPQEHIIVEL